MLTASNKQHQRGFTLIELVVVIVIIGILAAFAIPRFANIATDARASSLRALAGTVRSTSALVHGLALARNVVNHDGVTAPIPIVLEGQGIAVVNSYPAATAAGIEASLTSAQGFVITHAAGVTTFQAQGAPTPASCQFTYTAAAANNPPAISATVETGC